MASNYLRQWRRNRKKAAAIAADSSSEDSGPGIAVDASSENRGIAVDSSSENRGPERDSASEIVDPSQREVDSTEDSTVEGNESEKESDERDTDSDFGYRQYASSSSSDCEQGSESKEENKTFQEKLQSWAVKSKCGRPQLNELLGILREEGLEVPKDARTLCKTPRQIQTQDKCGGQYLYFGIASSVKTILNQYHNFLESTNSVRLMVNIDGINLFKSSTDQFWPIMCSFSDFDPFIVALFLR